MRQFLIFHKFLYFSCGNCREKAGTIAGNGGYLSDHAIWEECQRTDVGLPVSKSHTISRSTRLLYRRYILTFILNYIFLKGCYLLVQAPKGAGQKIRLIPKVWKKVHVYKLDWVKFRFSEWIRGSSRILLWASINRALKVPRFKEF